MKVDEALRKFENSTYRKNYFKLKGKRGLDKDIFKKRNKSKKKYKDLLMVTCNVLWREILLLRADYICEMCGKGAVTIHHIIRKSDCGGMRFDLGNGIAVCAKCHGVPMGSVGFHGYGKEIWERFEERFPGRYEELKVKSRGYFGRWTIGSLENKKEQLTAIWDSLEVIMRAGKKIN